MSDPLAQAATWNLVADDYLESVVPHFEHYAADALALAAPKPEAEILDVACGPGTLTLLAARKVARVVAVDFSEEMITRLRERAGRAALWHVDAHVGDGRALEFSDRRFDAGFSMFGIFLFEGRGKGLRELSRVLLPGAPAVISSWITAERPARADHGAAGRVRGSGNECASRAGARHSRRDARGTFRRRL